MNLKLINNNSSFNLNILKDTPCSYLYKVAFKTFKIPMDRMILYYKDKEIPNNSLLIFKLILKENDNDFTNILEEEIITVKRNPKLRLQNNYQNSVTDPDAKDKNFLPLIESKQHRKRTIRLKTRKKNLIQNDFGKKKVFVKCNFCNIKNAVFYCRTCNTFVCLDCNLTHQAHLTHEKINVEDGDILIGCDVYRDEILGYLIKVEKAYNISNEWLISDEDRENYFDKLTSQFESIKKNSQSLSFVTTGYTLNQEMFDTMKKDIGLIQPPRHKEEIKDVFTKFHNVEKEVKNYIQTVDLQIIKSEYNKKMLKLLRQVEIVFEKIIKDVNNKLDICESLNDFEIDKTEKYLKDYEVKLAQLHNNKSISGKNTNFSSNFNNYMNNINKINSFDGLNQLNTYNSSKKIMLSIDSQNDNFNNFTTDYKNNNHNYYPNNLKISKFNSGMENDFPNLQNKNYYNTLVNNKSGRNTEEENELQNDNNHSEKKNESSNDEQNPDEESNKNCFSSSVSTKSKHAINFEDAEIISNVKNRKLNHNEKPISPLNTNKNFNEVNSNNPSDKRFEHRFSNLGKVDPEAFKKITMSPAKKKKKKL